MLTKYLPMFFRRTSFRSIRFSHQTRLDLDQLLERLDGEAHRRGRLNAGLVRGAIEKATNELSNLNSTQALLLIRCTGSLLINELPRQRQQILDEMMKIFKTKFVPFDVTHYNSYMRVSLQNHSFFDPMKILSEMKMSNIQPNLTSFRLLIECFARQGRSDQIEKLLNEMKNSKFNIESLTLTHLLASYARNGDVERVESLYKLFVELDLKPLSETFEQFVVVYLRHDEIDRARKSFEDNRSKFDNDSLFRLLIETARVNAKDLFDEIRRSIDENSLADVCVQYVICATNLFELNLDEFALSLIDSFPRRDETLRFDLINLSMLNLMKIRLPSNHLRSFSISNESIDENELKTFRENLLNRIEFFTDRKDRWLIVHQFLHHAYLNSIPMPYIYLIYEKLRDEQFDYRPHYIRPVLVKFQRIYAENPEAMRSETTKFLEFLQKTFSIDFDDETIDLLIEHFFDFCRSNPNEIDSMLKKVNFRLNVYWSNLYLSTLKRLNRSSLNSLKIFLNSTKTNRVELTSKMRDETIYALDSLINRLSVVESPTTNDELKEIVDFLDIFNKRFAKNSSIDLTTLNENVLNNIFRTFHIDFRDQISPTIRLVSTDASNEVFVKTTRNPRTMSIRELEDHLIELKRKKMNPSGIISKLLMKYSSECLDGERTMTKPVRQAFAKRIAELETIYFDKKQTTGFPSLGVIAILIDYYSRVDCNLDKVISYIQLSNELNPNFKLDPHKCVSVIRLLIRKDSFDKSIELIDSLGRYENVPNYMYRRVRDLLLDAFRFLKFEQFNVLVQKLLNNHYVDPSSTVLSLIVRKSYEDHGPLHAFETSKTLLVQYNNLLGFFPIIRKLLRDDCSEELKQVLVQIGRIRSRTFAYEQLALALIHERRPAEAVRVCQFISRTTFEEHCQRYVRELFFFPSNNNDSFESEHVYDHQTISLIYFLDYFEEFQSNTRHLNIDSFFFHLLKSYEKANRLDELTKFMRDRSSKYLRNLSTKTKDAFSQAGITLPIKSLTSSNRRSMKNERFLDEKEYEEDQQVVETTT